MKSIVDLWSAIHFGFWAFVASTVAASWEPPLWAHIFYTLILGYVWEGFEYWASRKWPDRWSHRVESWQNSLIGDPICNVCGSVFGWFVVAFYRGHYRFL